MRTSIIDLFWERVQNSSLIKVEIFHDLNQGLEAIIALWIKEQKYPILYK